MKKFFKRLSAMLAAAVVTLCIGTFASPASQKINTKAEEIGGLDLSADISRYANDVVEYRFIKYPVVWLPSFRGSCYQYVNSRNTYNFYDISIAVTYTTSSNGFVSYGAPFFLSVNRLSTNATSFIDTIPTTVEMDFVPDNTIFSPLFTSFKTSFSSLNSSALPLHLCEFYVDSADAYSSSRPTFVFTWSFGSAGSLSVTAAKQFTTEFPRSYITTFPLAQIRRL